MFYKHKVSISTQENEKTHWIIIKLNIKCMYYLLLFGDYIENEGLTGFSSLLVWN
jgi:hypothetical protein